MRQMMPSGSSFVRSLPMVAALLFLTAPTASAEFYVSGYLGASVTQDSDVKDRDHMTSGFPAFSLRFRDVSFDTSVTGGGKVGYWLGPLPNLGIEAEAYHFSPDIGRQTVTVAQNFFGGPIGPGTRVTLGTGGFDRASIGVTGLGIHLVGRLRFLQDTAFPKGRLQPYAGVGPGIFFTSVRLKPFTNRSESDADVGIQALGGLKYFFHKNVSAFAEYKFSHFGLDVDFATAGIGGGTAKLTTGVTTHHVSGGIAVHFDMF